MNFDERRQFLRNFCDNMRDSAVMMAGKMPEEWDGHELRKYLADKFAWEVSERMRGGRSTRVKNYVNECITRNL